MHRKMTHGDRFRDEILVLRCQEGDVAAFEELVDRWQERLWRHAWRLTGDDDAAWDALQEGWIAISRGIRKLSDPVAFPAWAYRIVSNKCRDWIRREQRRRKASESQAEEAARRENLATEGKRENDVATLRQALDLLPGRDRAILSLYYLEGFATAEIAEILDIPTGTVKSRMHHARQRLRTIMEETENA